MKYLILFVFLLLPLSSLSLSMKDCERLEKNNNLHCVSKYWNKIAKISRKGIILEYSLYPDNRLKGVIKNTSDQRRYVYIRWVLHDSNLTPIMSDSYSITILKPDEETKIDFIFHEEVYDKEARISSKKPLSHEGVFLRLRDFEVK